MKVLFVYPFCGLGGVETATLHKLDALALEGIDAHALFGTVYGSAGATVAHDPRVTLGLEAAALPGLLSAYDAVVVIDDPDFVDTLERLRFHGLVLFETHASSPASIGRFHTRLNHPRIAAIVVPAEFNRRLVETALVANTPVEVVPNPVDLTPLEAAASRQQTVFPTGAPILLWVGRLEDAKNPTEFVRIAERLIERRPDVHLVILGDAPDTAEYDAYVARLRSFVSGSTAAKLTFVRAIPHAEMPAAYAQVAASGGCLVSTSLHESAPMTFIEAMAAGCPVVTSRVGGVGELVRDGETGRTYELGDVAGAVGAIDELLDGSMATRRQQLLGRARASVTQRHAPASVGARYRAVLATASNGVTQSGRSVVRDQPEGDVAVTAEVVRGLVSTIIPVYNRAAMLREAVGSVLAQTYRAIEVIVVDDGSTDGTAAVCDELAAANPVVTVLHITHTGRAGLAREAGRRVARGEYLQYLDSDDLIAPTKFASMVSALENSPECDIAYSYTRRYRVGAAPTDTPAALTGETFTTMLPAFLGRRYWETSTPVYRRRLCDAVGAWTNLLIWEDIEHDVRMATHHPRLCHVREWLTDMRDHDSGRLSGTRFLENPGMLGEAVRGSILIYRHVRAAGMSYADEYLRMFVDDLRLMHNKCKEHGLQAEADACAEVVLDATGTSDPATVGEYTVRAAVAPQRAALRLQPGEAQVCPVVVTNRSSVAFHGGECASELSYHLLEADGAVLRFDNPIRVLFDQPLAPAESRTVDLWIRAPNVSGLYYVELDILWAGCTWLNSIGSPPAFVKLLVGAPTTTGKWWLHAEPTSDASLEYPPGDDRGVRVQIHAAPGSVAWHIQLNYGHVSVIAHQRYVVSWKGRADGNRQMNVAVSRAYDPWDTLGLYESVDVTPDWRPYQVEFVATATDDRGRIHFDMGASAVSVEMREIVVRALGGEPTAAPPFALPGRLGLDIGVEPLSYRWGTDRGLPVHRYYLEQFLDDHASDVKGRVLEFQDPQYARRFGGGRVTSLDILHIDDSNPQATLVADLTKPNALAGDCFDCIVCTHVLHMITDVPHALREMCRLLKEDGVLLIAVPHISMCSVEYGEIWRFTPLGLEYLLSEAFGAGQVEVHSYGNSLTAAGEIRGSVAAEFLRAELEHHDSRFAVEVCARVTKRSCR